jgi:plastocyanin domain-containing protein
MNKKTKNILIALAASLVILFVFFAINKTSISNKNISSGSNIQVIKMLESAQGYTPNQFTIKKGVPVRWEIEASADRTCASALIVPDYKIREFLKPGKNVVEFTPSQTGTIPFSCSMRMYTGSFKVIE